MGKRLNRIFAMSLVALLLVNTTQLNVFAVTTTLDVSGGIDGENVGMELTSGEAGSESASPGISVYYTDKNGNKDGTMMTLDLSGVPPYDATESGMGITHVANNTTDPYDVLIDDGSGAIDTSSSVFTKYLVIERTDGSDFSFDGFTVSTIGSLRLNVEGFNNGSSTGSVTLPANDDFSPTFRDNSFTQIELTPSKFQMVDQVRITGNSYMQFLYTNAVDGTLSFLETSLNVFFKSFTISGAVAPASTDATLKNTSTVKGATVTSLGTPGLTLGAESAGSVSLTDTQAQDTSNLGSYITLFDPTDANASSVKVVKYANGDDSSGFETDSDYSNAAVTDGDFFIIKVTAEDLTTEAFYKVNASVTSSSAVSATSSADTQSPTSGANISITLNALDGLSSVFGGFGGDHDVTISGVEAAPDGTYGSFDGTVLDASSAGAGQVVPITFSNGEAVVNLKLNKADAQTIIFSIDGIATPEASGIVITPTPDTAPTMSLTQDITAPSANGGNFAQQPIISVVDGYANTVTNYGSTTVYVTAGNSSSWNLKGTTSVNTVNGVATFSGLGATNSASVSGAYLNFSAIGLSSAVSSSVTLPAPSTSSSNGSSNSSASSSTSTTSSSGTTALGSVSNGAAVTGSLSNNTINGTPTLVVSIDETALQNAIVNGGGGDSRTISIQPSVSSGSSVQVSLSGQTFNTLSNDN